MDKPKRSTSITVLAVCFVLFGLLSIAGWLDYMAMRLAYGEVGVEAFKIRISAQLSFVPESEKETLRLIWQSRELKGLEDAADVFLKSPPFRWFIHSTLLLGIMYTVLGVGLWQLRPLARQATIATHLALIPLHTGQFYQLFGYFSYAVKTHMPYMNMMIKTQSPAHLKALVLIAIFFSVSYLAIVMIVIPQKRS